MVGFRLKVFECNPQQLYQDLRPDNCLASIWIPQTLGDQIWLWFEFANKEDKKAYIKWVKSSNITSKNTNGKIVYAKDMFMHSEKWLTQKQINHHTND